MTDMLSTALIAVDDPGNTVKTSSETGTPGAAGTEPAGGGGQMLLIIGVFFVVMYLLILRPQKKREEQEKQMRSALEKGDEVLTVGGVRGSVFAIEGEEVVIKTGETKIRFIRGAISKILNKKGTTPAS